MLRIRYVTQLLQARCFDHIFTNQISTSSAAGSGPVAQATEQQPNITHHNYRENTLYSLYFIHFRNLISMPAENTRSDFNCFVTYSATRRA